MLIQTTVPPNTTPIKSSHHKASSTRRSNRPLQVDVDHFKRHKQLPTIDGSAKPITVSTETVAELSQLDLILAKLTELETIKTHLNTIDTRLNLLQPPSTHSATVAQRS